MEGGSQSNEAMKVNIDKTWWGKLNVLSKACFAIGITFIDWSMKLSGLSQEEKA